MKDGDVPQAYSPAFENVIAERGLHMEKMKGRALVSEDSKRMCRQLLQAEHEAPQYTSYPLTEFLAVWDQTRTRNEYKIFRDLTPLLAPFPELLFASGYPELEHVKDELSVEWSRSKTMGQRFIARTCQGPCPRLVTKAQYRTCTVFSMHDTVRQISRLLLNRGVRRVQSRSPGERDIARLSSRSLMRRKQSYRSDTCAISSLRSSATCNVHCTVARFSFQLFKRRFRYPQQPPVDALLEELPSGTVFWKLLDSVVTAFTDRHHVL